MKIFFISNIYKEEEKKEVERLKKEIKRLGLDDYQIYVYNGIVDNRGYAYGINRGIEKGLKEGADIFVVFNSDISLNGLDKKAIINGLKNYDVFGFAVKQGGKVYYGGEIDRWRLSGGLIEKNPEKKYVNVDFVSGSLMFIKRKVIEKIGLWDESYFLYYEELDFCWRAKKAGFKVGIDTKHSYQHFELSVNNPRKDYFLAKNRFKFFLKYSNFFQKIREVIRLPKTFFELLPLVYKSRFLTNLFSLNFSSFINKIFHFILFIFLVRTLSPDQYGVYIIVWAFIGLFNPVIDLGTTNYGLIYLPKEQKSLFDNLISMRFYFSLIIFFLTDLIAVFLFQRQPEIIIYIFLTSVVILTNAWSGSYLIINSVQGKVFRSSLVSLIFNGLYIGLIIIGLLIIKKLMIIFVIVFFSFFLYLLINYFLIKKTIGQFKIVLNFLAWKKILKKSYLFVLITLLAGLYFKLNVFLLKHFQSEEAVGIYSSGYKFFDALLLLAASYNITVMPIFSQIVNNRHLLRKKIIKDVLLLLGIGGIIVVGFYFFGPIILPLILKKNYLAGIAVAKIVIITLPVVLLSSIFYNILYAAEKTKYVLYLYLFQVVFNFFLNLIYIPRYSYWATAWIMVLTEALCLLISFYFVNRQILRQ